MSTTLVTDWDDVAVTVSSKYAYRCIASHFLRKAGCDGHIIRVQRGDVDDVVQTAYLIWSKDTTQTVQLATRLAFKEWRANYRRMNERSHLARQKYVAVHADLIPTFLPLYRVQGRKWTSKQRRIVGKLLRGKTLPQVAEELSISRGSVWNVLKRLAK